jgi:hypothetical protein
MTDQTTDRRIYVTSKDRQRLESLHFMTGTETGATLLPCSTSSTAR